MTVAAAVTERGPRGARRVLFTDAADPRVAAALRRLGDEPRFRPVVLDAAPVDIRGVDVLAPALAVSAATIDRIAERRSVPTKVVTKLMARPIYAAVACLADGLVDALVLGVTSHTADVLLACEMLLGHAKALRVASSSFLLDVPAIASAPARRLLFADCAVNPSPTAEELADIAIASAEAATWLLGTAPRVAMLSFSTHGSAVHPDVEKVQRATELVRERAPELAIDGEIQADAALDPIVAGHKAATGPTAGDANVLVFPDLDAANIGYKLVRTLARAEAIGAFLQGFGAPIAKLSRGATDREIEETARLLFASH